LPLRRCDEAAQRKGTEQRSSMKVVRHACHRLGRILLVSAMMSSTLAKSAVGEALVLHEHGVLRAHLHVLGFGDLFSNVAKSSWFGHCPSPKPALQSASPRVRILAIVTTGSVFVSTPRSAGNDAAGADSLSSCPLVSIAGSQGAPTLDSPAFLCPARLGRTACTVILLRNHTLLL